MTRQSVPSRLRARPRPLTAVVLALAATALALTFSVPQQAGARTAGAACVTTSTRAGRDSRPCAPDKTKRHRKSKRSHSHHSKRHGKHGANAGPGAGSEPDQPAAVQASCSDGTNATASGDGSFICASGSEPGCPEGFAPIVADGGSTLLCESEAGSGEEAEEEVEEESE